MEHGGLAAVLLAFASALIGAKAFGALADRFKQPVVLGELVAGAILGPSALGLVPLTEGVLLLAEIGVILLLFEVGLETDLEELLRVGGSAMAVAFVGMVLPFFGGYFLTAYAGYPTRTAIFAGAALTATSISITARVLSELRALATREGQIILGAAVADDVLGLVVLAVVSQLAHGASIDAMVALKATALATGFLLVAIGAGIPIGHRLVRYGGKSSIRGVLGAACFAFALLIAWSAQKAGSAPIVGAFAAGLVLARTNRKHEINRALAPVVDIFAPLFFVSVGSQVDARTLNPVEPSNRGPLLVALGLTVVGIVGKFAAGFVAFGPVRRAFIGVGMIPRGEVGLIFASIGRATGGLPPPLFTAVVLAIFATTFCAPPLLAALRPPRSEPVSTASGSRP